jgi:hypothetical protein
MTNDARPRSYSEQGELKMPDEPTAPAQPMTIPDFRRVSEADYRTGFDTLIQRLARDEIQHASEAPPKPLADPKLSNAEYEKKYREMRYRLSRG